MFSRERAQRLWRYRWFPVSWESCLWSSPRKGAHWVWPSVDEYMVQVERKRKVTPCQSGNLKDFWGTRTVYTTAVGSWNCRSSWMVYFRDASWIVTCGAEWKFEYLELYRYALTCGKLDIRTMYASTWNISSVDAILLRMLYVVGRHRDSAFWWTGRVLGWRACHQRQFQ